MYEVNSQTITEDYKAKETPLSEWKFKIDNGNVGEKTISDALLDSQVLAEERAKSEFLKNSHKLKEVTFTTPLTNLVKNGTINIYGIPYIVKSLSTKVNEVSIKTAVKAVRYG